MIRIQSFFQLNIDANRDMSYIPLSSLMYHNIHRAISSNNLQAILQVRLLCFHFIYVRMYT